MQRFVPEIRGVGSHEKGAKFDVFCAPNLGEGPRNFRRHL